jgi:hypothetical protein
MKSIYEKFLMYFSSIVHHIISHVAKFKIKIPLVRGEIKKKRNLSKRWIGPIQIVLGSKLRGIRRTKWIGDW